MENLNQTKALEAFSRVSYYKILGMCLVLQEIIPDKANLVSYNKEELLEWIRDNHTWKGKWIPRTMEVESFLKKAA